jgi:hypothetical protein
LTGPSHQLRDIAFVLSLYTLNLKTPVLNWIVLKSGVGLCSSNMLKASIRAPTELPLSLSFVGAAGLLKLDVTALLMAVS